MLKFQVIPSFCNNMQTYQIIIVFIYFTNFIEFYLACLNASLTQTLNKSYQIASKLRIGTCLFKHDTLTRTEICCCFTYHCENINILT